MGKVGKWATVDKGGRALQGLHEVRFDGVLKEQGQSARDVEFLGSYGAAVAGVGDDDFAEALFHIFKVGS